MIDSNTPADWAIEMAVRESGESHYGAYSPTLLALARRIERSEQLPVDPLVEEAAKVCETLHYGGSARDLREGIGSSIAGRLALAAIRRGYELGKEAGK